MVGVVAGHPKARRDERVNRAARVAVRVASVLACTAVVCATLLLCGGALLVAALSPETGYNPPTTAAGWTREIVRSTHELLTTSALLATALIVMCAITVSAALLRRIGWSVIGSVCVILLALTQVGVSFANFEMDKLAGRAVAAVGNTTAIEPQSSAEPEPEPITVQDTRQEMSRLLQATLEVAVAPVVNESGEPIAIEQVDIRATPCGESGSRLGAAVALNTGDNAASLRAILAAWDRAGYLPDRAMQEDLRYSTTLPLERMSIRDTSTTDGLIHMGIESTCATASQ